MTTLDTHQLSLQIKQWGKDLGFQQVGITDTHLTEAENHLKAWLAKKYHANMTYMEQHLEKRTHPEKLIPGTLRIISCRINYLPPNTRMLKTLQNKRKAYISRYALGRDYHKKIRKSLQTLAEKITDVVGPFGYRAFSDSAPVLEKAIAEKAGLGWIGKHTVLINREAGSWFFLGELYTDLPLPLDTQTENHCGTCTACLDICPTKAIVAPYTLDASRCISYLTIENKGPIPEPLRRAIGNRIFGCDDCQLICPWNKFAKFTDEKDFHPRHHLDNRTLVELFNWTEAEFEQRTRGSAIRRAGYTGWRRNLAVALGNAPKDPDIQATLKKTPARSLPSGQRTHCVGDRMSGYRLGASWN